MSGSPIIQLGASTSQLYALSESGERTLLRPPEAAPAVTDPVQPKAKPKSKPGEVVARIGAPRRSYAAELRERRKILDREVKRLRQFETELREVDQMLAAIKTTARKKS
jgi:hypothetical protein